MLAVMVVTSGVRAEARSTEHGVPRERITCSIAAGLEFGVPINIILAVAEAEGGIPGQWVPNRNGSFDIGPLQFNTRYLEHLQRQYGITAADVAAAGCYPYQLAAWRLRRHIQLDQGDLWTRVANYHSRQPNENEKYRRRLVAKAATWGRWLAQRFATYAVDGATAEGGGRQGKGKAVRRHGANIVAARKERDSDASDITSLEDLLEEFDDGGAHGAELGLPSRSTGVAHAGTLLNGVQLPRHRAYRLVDPSRAWGTSKTIDALVEAFDELAAADPAAPRVEVHDLSLAHGGRMHGHKSHQNGRDVDITYYQRTTRGVCAGRRVRPDELDARREWHLLRHWLERGQAEFIFVDYSLQRPLYEAAKASGATEHELAEWFQYPRSAEIRAGVIRHVPNHANHAHVRFRCAPQDRTSKGISATIEPPVDGELLELLAE